MLAAAGKSGGSPSKSSMVSAVEILCRLWVWEEGVDFEGIDELLGFCLMNSIGMSGDAWCICVAPDESVSESESDRGPSFLFAP